METFAEKYGAVLSLISMTALFLAAAGAVEDVEPLMQLGQRVCIVALLLMLVLCIIV